MTLDQLATNLGTTITNTTTNVVASFKAPFLSLIGDLRQVPARDINYAAARLDEAFARLLKRFDFLQQRKGSVSAKKLSAAGVPPLTPIEREDLQKRLEQLSASGNGALFGSPDFDMMVLMIAFGILGGTIKCFASLVQYVGTGKFVINWAIYYLLYPLIGGLMAIAFFLVLRGGMVKDLSVDTTNIFAVCAVAMIIGMFSDEATKKLAKIATALFTDNTGNNAAEDGDPVLHDCRIKGSPGFAPESILNPRRLAHRFNIRLAAAGTAGTSKPGTTILPMETTTSAKAWALASAAQAAAGIETMKAEARVSAVKGIEEIRDLEDLSQFLAEHLSVTKRAWQEDPSDELQTRLRQALTDDLNRIIKSEPLYRAPLFEQTKSQAVLKLRQTLLKMKIEPAEVIDMQRLNRLLLVDVYPNDLIAWVVDLIGLGFAPNTIVMLDGKSLPEDEKPVFVNDSSLELKLKLANHEPGTVVVNVTNPDPKGGHSNALSISLI
jgi:hypothetical protein